MDEEEVGGPSLRGWRLEGVGPSKTESMIYDHRKTQLEKREHK